MVERPNGDEYVIRSEQGKFIIRNSSVVPAARFTYKSATEGRGNDATKNKHRHYVVTADSALAFIGSDRIWLMKGAMVLVVGDVDSVTYAAIVHELRNAVWRRVDRNEFAEQTSRGLPGSYTRDRYGDLGGVVFDRRFWYRLQSIKDRDLVR